MSKMFIYVCDKCNEKIETGMSTEERHTIVADSGIQYDLCSSCYRSFNEWLNRNPKWEPAKSIVKVEMKKEEAPKEEKKEKTEKKDISISFESFFKAHAEDIFEPKIYERLVGPSDRPAYQKTDANKAARTRFMNRMEKMSIITVDDFLTRFDNDKHFLADIANGKDLNSTTTKYYKNIYAIILRFIEFDYGPGKINRFQRKFLEEMDKKLAEEHAKTAKEK